MKQTRLLMGMPISVEIVENNDNSLFDEVYDYFTEVDRRYSTYKEDSEISRINRGLKQSEWSGEMKRMFAMCELTKRQTNGYFDIKKEGLYDPSGLVKGWAIQMAANLLKKRGVKNFFIDAGGDIQVSGKNSAGDPWTIGIRNPFNRNENIKTIQVDSEGVATSGTAIRGQHIYNPYSPNKDLHEVSSITVIGPDIYNADRFATAAFAMGKDGIKFVEGLKGFEAYMVTPDKTATMTSGFERFVLARV